MTGESLKTAPKGYPKDHPNIELLRMKSFLVTHEMPDADWMSDHLVDDLLGTFKAMNPFNNYFAVAIS